MKIIVRFPVAACCTLLSVLFLVVSCAQSAEKSGEKMLENALEQSTGENTDVDIDEGTLTFESDSMRAVVETEAKTWPDDAPSEVPEFTWGDIAHTTFSEYGETKSWGVHLKNVPLDALGKYEAELKKAGFKTSRFTMNKGGNVTGQNGKFVVTVTIGEGNGHVGIQLEP
jgi:hypothetical protein